MQRKLYTIHVQICYTVFVGEWEKPMNKRQATKRDQEAANKLQSIIRYTIWIMPGDAYEETKHITEVALDSVYSSCFGIDHSEVYGYSDKWQQIFRMMDDVERATRNQTMDMFECSLRSVK